MPEPSAAGLEGCSLLGILDFCHHTDHQSLNPEVDSKA